MSNYSGIIRIEKEGESEFKYKYEHVESSQKPLFEFIFRILYDLSEEKWHLDEHLINGYKLRILVYTPNEIISQKNQKNKIPFGQEGLMGDIEKTPIIHIVLTDFLNDSLHSENEQLHPMIPRYFQIIDSNIWNHYVPMVNKDGFYALFSKAVNDIYDNYKKGLYTLEVAGEFADINARILQQSYLTGHHGMGVAPFIFHSEGYIKKLIDDKFKRDCVINRIRKRKWRFLLVDDKANYPMTLFEELKDGRLNTKFKIIKNRLESIFTDSTDSNKFQIFDKNNLPKDEEQCGILIESVSNIDEAKESLKKREYDIILLDYLLDKGKNGGYEYGYDLLNDINKSLEEEKNATKDKNKPTNEDKNNKYLIGPRGCYFFMFISAYPSAVHERLLAEGLNRHESYWNINVGACPTNTPQLFLYNLLKFMDRRLERLGINRLSPEEIIEQILVIFNPKDKKTVREMADDEYQNVLSLQYHHRRMLNDVKIPAKDESLYYIDKGSVLVTDFIQQNEWLGGFLEHLSHLVYLVAFGTARQWPEMWEEYLYIRPHLAQIESPSEKERKEGIKNKNVSKWIEFYISKLKQQQR